MLLVGFGLSALSYSVLAQLLNELKSFMRMYFARIDRTSAFAGALCLVAACLTGCASKNPLIDEPASAAPVASANKTSEQPAQTAVGKSASETSVTTGAPTGIRRLLGFFTPYRVDIQQGNFVSREMITQLKEGMQGQAPVTREQVRFALGTPLLTDIFHADRWDYVFRLKKRNGEVISSRVSVFFQDNRLVRIEGGQLPTEQEYLALIAGAAPGAAATDSGK